MEELQKNRQYLSPVLTKQTDIMIESGKGCYITDSAGKVYLDLVQGIATNPLGHCHEKIIEAITQQSKKLIGASFSYYDIPVTLKLLKKLANVLPESLDSILFSNSGGEANEGAIKLAKFYTKRNGIIGFLGAFHGRGYGAVSVTSISAKGRSDCGSLLSDVYIVPYPAKNQCPKGYNEEEITQYCLKQLQNTFDYLIAPNNVAGIIIEPVLGDGGYFVPPVGFMKELEKICKVNGILLIYDEVQTGYGRTGNMFACQHFDIIPDIITLGKPMASGLPMSALVSSKKIMENWKAGKHGGTSFVGNPISSAAALALLEVYEEVDILGNCRIQGKYFKECLDKIKNKYTIVGDVRGLGLMLGMEFSGLGNDNPGEVLKKIQGICISNGLVTASCGLKNEVMRFIAPLNITQNEINEAIKILDNSIKKYMDGK